MIPTRKTNPWADWHARHDGPKGGAAARDKINRTSKDVLPTVCRVSASGRHPERASSHDGLRAPGSAWLALLKNGHFGTREEKRSFFRASQRFKILVTGTRSPFRSGTKILSEDSALLDQCELWDALDGIDFNNILNLYSGPGKIRLSGDDPDLVWNPEANSFADSVLIKNSVVHGATENPYRDLPQPLFRMHTEQVLDYARRALRSTAYRLLVQVICHDVTCASVGRDQQQYVGTSPANAAAGGMGQVRAALIVLVEFFDDLDRLESGELSIRQWRRSILADLAARQIPGSYVWCAGWCYTHSD
jgi:hypothetical protein